MFGTGTSGIIGVRLVLVNGKVWAELEGKTPEDATPEEISSLFDRLKAGTLSALEKMRPKAD